MLTKNQLRRDLRWLKRQARKDRRITLSVLAGLLALWGRQLSPADAMPSSPPLLALSLGLAVASAVAWLMSAYFLARTVRPRGDSVEALRWVSRVSRAKEWAFCSLCAFVAWHLLQFVTALFLG
ncbi:hypothetical protein [Nonomuraea cavernae]|uniref:Uncharacterized protein n=1 Tax=Nonomuraea cavernae TaxID=2045107 RepID=A0A918DJF0_9ACTN|nr:hypothetical protein [Nonomuraea cavernae]MCA2187360.1 hypothetical protein [Nonomuraea cavernae]GGO68376.1 hypothetical protein GCM10012289_27000 [Nonomuraea cavernae]